MKTEILKYANGLNAKSNVLNWLDSLSYKKKDQGKIEHIIDFLIHKDFTDSSWWSYKLLLEKSNKWIKQLSQNVSRIDEVYGEDIETVLDFEDGFRFVKLLSESAYRREGALMSHCVSSYYGREVDIFSLRDEFNKPHCTIEQDIQIKGKGNGSIHPKYIDYVVSFLEWTGMKVRDSEMQNLGYITPKFHRFIKNKLYKNKYIRDDEKVQYLDNVVIIKNIDDVDQTKKDLIYLLDNNLTIYKKTKTSIVEVSSYIDVRENATFTAPKLEKSGSIDVRENATFTAPKLEKSSYIDVRENATFTAPKLEKSGSIDVRENATFTAPKLIEVSSYIDVSENATFTAPKLIEVSGSIDVRENATFTAPKLEKSSYIDVSENATFTAPKLEKSGYIDVSENATFTAPKLEKSGSIDVRENATFTAPKLEKSGYIDVSENATFTAPKLEKSGYIDVRENATFTAPKLIEVSGSIDVRENATFTAPKLRRYNANKS